VRAVVGELGLEPRMTVSNAVTPNRRIESEADELDWFERQAHMNSVACEARGYPARERSMDTKNTGINHRVLR
jgi:hypothetical protein